MAAPKGNTNNPFGRPPKTRALTECLVKKLEAEYKFKGKKFNGNALLVDIATSIIFTGEAALPNGAKVEITGRDYMDFMKWIFTHVDGPARTEIDLYKQQTYDLSILTDDKLNEIGKLIEPIIEASEAGG